MTILPHIQIDSNGFLKRYRATKMKHCFCPYASNNMTIKCGDWCPHFGEPVMQPSSNNGSLYLSCCGTKFEGIIQDDRWEK